MSVRTTKTVPIIVSAEDHEQALARIDMLIGQTDSNNDPEIEALGLMIENYERKQFPFVPADPVTLLDYRMKSLGIKAAELAEKTGLPASRISEVLNRRRYMSKAFIRATTRVLGISPGLMLEDYPLAVDEEELAAAPLLEHGQ